MIQLVSVTNILKEFRYSKIVLIMGLIIIFSIILCFCRNDEFGGLINIDNKIDTIHSRIKGESHQSSNNYPNKKETIWELFFNRLYFVTVSTSMLGYGDIYPKSYRTRTLTIIYVLLIFFLAFI